MDQTSVSQANAALDIVHEIATLLDTGLDKDEVAILIALVENGVNPEARIYFSYGSTIFHIPTGMARQS